VLGFLDEDILAIRNRSASLAPLVTPKGTPGPNPVTPQEVTPSNALDTPAQAYEGLVTRSRAKLLQQEVHPFLSRLHTNIDENFILPNCFTLVALRFTHQEENTTLHKHDPLKINDGLRDSVSSYSAKANFKGQKWRF
jgi:hypothetical protein